MRAHAHRSSKHVPPPPGMDSVLPRSDRRRRRSRWLTLTTLAALCAALVLQPRPAALAAAGDVSTVAGTGDKDTSGDGGPTTSAAFETPSGIAVGAHGTLVSQIGHDAQSSRVRLLSGGTVTTVAGGVDA